MHEKAIINAIRARTDDPIILALLDSLLNARKQTYQNICVVIDNEICGDIFQIQHGQSDIVLSVGTDGIKNILFEQMGFTPDDALEMGL